MPRFYFHLTSKDSRIPDESGKELNTLNNAYVYARNLIDKILFHVGYDDAEAWKVIISNNSYEAQMIVPFPMSYSHRAHLQSESNNEIVSSGTVIGTKAIQERCESVRALKVIGPRLVSGEIGVAQTLVKAAMISLVFRST